RGGRDRTGRGAGTAQHPPGRPGGRRSRTSAGMGGAGGETRRDRGRTGDGAGFLATGRIGSPRRPGAAAIARKAAGGGRRGPGSGGFQPRQPRRARPARTGSYHGAPSNRGDRPPSIRVAGASSGVTGTGR